MVKVTTRSPPRKAVVGLLAAILSSVAFSGEVYIDGGQLTLNGDIELADGKIL